MKNDTFYPSKETGKTSKISGKLPTVLQEKPESSSDRYKIYIPANVERKFRTLCALSPRLEWSGVLFYKISGSFEENNLEVHCVDFFLMDQGGEATTEINFNTPDIAGYMAQNMELLDCYQGLAHSHHNMQTFFSGTDEAALEQEGYNMNNFVSLIVNNRGDYTARITRKVLHTTKEDVQSIETSEYPFFDNGVVTLPDKAEHVVREFKTCTIEYVNLIIEKETVDEDETSKRFSEVISKKKTTTPVNKAQPFGNLFGGYDPYAYPAVESYTKPEPKKENKEQKPEKKEETKKNEFVVNHEDYDLAQIAESLTWNEEDFENLLRQLILGTPLANKNVKIESLKKNLHPIYEARFGLDNEYTDDESFQNWLEGWVQWLLFDYDYEWIYSQCEEYDLDITEIVAIVAAKLVSVLEEFPESIYRTYIINELESYVEL